MATSRPSPCGRFVILDGLYVDCTVFQNLSRRAAASGLSVQDAIQLVICALNDAPLTAPMPPAPASSSRVILRPPATLDSSD